MTLEPSDKFWQPIYDGRMKGVKPTDDEFYKKYYRRSAEEEKNSTAKFWMGKYLGMQPELGREGGKMLWEPLPELVEARKIVIQAVKYELQQGAVIDVDHLSGIYKGIADAVKKPRSSLPYYLEGDCLLIANQMKEVIDWTRAQLLKSAA